MRDNLIAKFIPLIKNATLFQFPSVQDIDIIIDNNIDNPSNKDVIDCAVYFKDFSKKVKKGSDII
jgi:hypothetical protein